MAKEYLLKQKDDGNFTAIELPESGVTIPVGQLTSQLRMAGGEFQHNSNQVKWAKYAEEGGSFLMIDIPILKWMAPIVYRDMGFYVGGNKPREVYLKDVTVIVRSGAEREFYMASRIEGRIPRLTNIWEDGKICTGGVSFDKDWVFLHPQEAIKALETSQGNLDLKIDDIIRAHEEDGKFVISPKLYDATNSYINKRIHLK